MVRHSQSLVIQDVNRNNQVNYTEFLAAALETQGYIQEYRLAEAFDLMDSDDSGYSEWKSSSIWSD